MKWKNIVPLAAILVVLLAIIMLMQTAEEPQSIEEAVGFVRLVPESVERSDIQRLELFAGEKPEEKLVLARSAQNPQRWMVASHVDAPVSAEKVESFLDILMDLRGEPREQGVSEKGLEDYVLQSDKAFQVAGYGGDGAKLFHLLEGKRDEYNEGFARRNEANDVYLIDESLKREAGIYGEETDKAPEYGMWLDKLIYEVAQDSVERIEMTAPGKRLVVEQQAPPAEASAEEENAADEEPQEAEEENAASEPEWVIAEGGPDLPTKDASIKNFLQSMAKMQCIDYVDPARKAELGLEGETPFRTVLTSNELDEEIVIQGNRPDPSENGYIVVSTKPDRVFEMAKNIFEKIFGIETSADFFEDEGLGLAYDDMQRLEYVQPSGPVALARDGDDWQVVAPAAPLPTLNLTAAGIGRLLDRWQPDEYFAADTPDTGLAQPSHTVTVATADATKTIRVGNEAKFYDGRYAQVEGDTRIVLMKRLDMEKIFLDPNDLYERKLFDAGAEEAAMLMVQKGGDAVVLSRMGTGWRATSLDGDQEVDEDAVDAVLTAVLDLQAEDILFGQEALPGTPEGTVAFTDGAGDRHEIVFGPEQEGVRLAALPDKNLVFEVNAMDAAEILVDPATLAREIEAAPADTSVETTEGAAPLSPENAAHAVDPSAASAPDEAGPAPLTEAGPGEEADAAEPAVEAPVEDPNASPTAAADAVSAQPDEPAAEDEEKAAAGE